MHITKEDRKNILFYFILAVVAYCLLIGSLIISKKFNLGDNKENKSKTINNIDNNDLLSRFQILDKSFNSTSFILVDNETKVMYLFLTNKGAGGLTQIVDQNGKPILYTENMEEVS